MLCRDLPNWSTLLICWQQIINNAVVGEFFLPCSSTQNHIWPESVRQRNRTFFMGTWGSNCRLCSPGCWPKSHSAISGSTINVTVIFPTQFTICSSATADAFLTNLNFFTILRHSGNPWISFFSMPPQPGSEDPIFKLTVKTHNCKYLHVQCPSSRGKLRYINLLMIDW